MLGGKPKPGSSEVFKRDAARYRTAGSVRAVPIKDEHPRRSASLDGRNHRRPRIVRGGKPAEDLGRIAVKVINHYGDEILKVYGV